MNSDSNLRRHAHAARELDKTRVVPARTVSDVVVLMPVLAVETVEGDQDHGRVLSKKRFEPTALNTAASQQDDTNVQHRTMIYIYYTLQYCMYSENR